MEILETAISILCRKKSFNNVKKRLKGKEKYVNMVSRIDGSKCQRDCDAVSLFFYPKERRSMNRKRKNLPAEVLTAGIFCVLLFSVILGSIWADTERKTYHLIPGSNNSVCTGRLTASSYLVNTGETVTFRLKEGGNPADFIGRIIHNKTAKYTFDKVSRYQIKAEGVFYEKDVLEYIFDKPGDYTINGYITFRWSTGKYLAGFPKYSEKTIVVSCNIRVSDMDDATEPEQPESKGEDKEENLPQLAGSVSHTEEWENNRRRFNRRCRELGKSDWIRKENFFFSGEKFMLTAVENGKNPPSSVKAVISGTDYETILCLRDDEWKGSLFHPSMIGKWGQKEPESLTFVFSAYIDGVYCEDRQQVVIDDRQPYWLFHRKE